MSADPNFDLYVGHCLSGSEIREIVRLGTRPSYSFVLLSPCCIQLRPVRTISADIRIRRDKITDESYRPYLGLVRGPRHIYDPETSEELPRIRLYVPARGVSFEEQRANFECFAHHNLIISVTDRENNPIPNAAINENLTNEQGKAIFLNQQAGTVEISVSAEGYETKKVTLEIPPYVHTVVLEKKKVQQYVLKHVIVSMNYSGQDFFEIHMVIPARENTSGEIIRDTAKALAKVLIADYIQAARYNSRNNFIEYSSWIVGRVETELRKFNYLVTPTEAQIIDSQRDKTRAVYEVDWKEMATEYDLQGNVIRKGGITFKEVRRTS